MEAFDIVCLGELLIDFVATTPGSLRAAPGFVKAPGGAPANVAVAASRLGLKVAFVGKVGDDEFGRFLLDTLRENLVDVTGLRLSSRGATPLAFVSVTESAERDFLFYWDRTADHFMTTRDIPARLVRSSRIFHYGSISLIHPATRSATHHALNAALSGARTFVSCDPNLRLNLWPSRVAAKRTVLETIKRAHLVKVNEDELKFLTGFSEVVRGMKALSRITEAAIIVTRGPKGAVFRWNQAEGEVPGFSVPAIDGTGAGDGFVAGFLRCLAAVPDDLRKLKPGAAILSDWVRYANAVGALATMKRGAIPAFPAPEDVEALLAGGRP
jgi:sugar/nucleoside kinase (ribokinase family)